MDGRRSMSPDDYPVDAGPGLSARRSSLSLYNDPASPASKPAAPIRPAWSRQPLFDRPRVSGIMEENEFATMVAHALTLQEGPPSVV
jgi:hypothetical protein